MPANSQSHTQKPRTKGVSGTGLEDPHPKTRAGLRSLEAFVNTPRPWLRRRSIRATPDVLAFMEWQRWRLQCAVVLSHPQPMSEEEKSAWLAAWKAHVERDGARERFEADRVASRKQAEQDQQQADRRMALLSDRARALEGPRLDEAMQHRATFQYLLATLGPQHRNAPIGRRQAEDWEGIVRRLRGSRALARFEEADRFYEQFFADRPRGMETVYRNRPMFTYKALPARRLTSPPPETQETARVEKALEPAFEAFRRESSRLWLCDLCEERIFIKVKNMKACKCCRREKTKQQAWWERVKRRMDRAPL